VFVHGLGASLDVWKGQLPFVRSGGRRAIAYDHRGHGESERPKDGVYSIDALTRDLDAVRQSLAVARIVLVGHSFSGDVVTAYAAAHPERVAGVVYVDADGDFGALSREAREKEVARAVASTRAQWNAEWEEVLGPHAKPATRAQVLASLEKLETPGLVALRSDNVFFPARALAARYSGPRWAIETDAPGAEFRAAALDPSIHLVTMRGVSHWMMLDDPAAFNAALGQALAAMP
jgi:pimeloyl-ACP methyl ester carboxylesterase